MAPPRIPWSLFALLSLSCLASALQVTPNSPCASICQDRPEFDVSAPASSNTKNSDIICDDASHAGAAGSKWKDCMSCLQNSIFSQGSENDQAWFLYNLRYSLSYCIFAYPNASEAGSTPCSTSMACGPLKDGFTHGILDPRSLTPYSYCAAGGGDAMDKPTYDRCLSCVSAEGRTEWLANYIVAVEAGCLQQPETGKILGLNDTIFAPNSITIVDPLTLIKAPDQGSGLPGTTIAGIVGAVLALLLILSAIIFICYRKRKNRRARADFEANRGNLRHRHKSSISFQCQTHAMSPRFWPGGDEAARSVHEDVEDAQKPTQHQPGDPSRRSSLWKPHNSISSYENSLDSTSEKAWDASYQEYATAAPKRGPAAPAGPLHHIKTSVPTMPRNARMSPSSAAVYNSPADIGTPMSAESTRSTTALLPGIKPYVPAEHGVHHNSPTPPSISSFSSPISGNTASPLLRSQRWPDPRPAQQQQPRSRLSTASRAGEIGVAISIPPPAVPWINAPTKKNTKKQDKTVGVGAPVESWEVQTTFAMPPPPPKR
jgi:hypothetical protein